MKRLALNLLTFLSLALFLAVACMWVRSLFRLDSSLWRFSSPSSFTYLDFVSGRGIFFFQRVRADLVGAVPDPSRTLDGDPPTSHAPWRSRPVGRWNYGDVWRTLGFRLVTHRTLTPSRVPGGSVKGAAVIVVVPYWFLAVATAVLPALRARRWLKRRRARGPGFCRACGYDLRASRDRCPECGTSIPVQPAR